MEPKFSCGGSAGLVEMGEFEAELGWGGGLGC